MRVKSSRDPHLSPCRAHARVVLVCSSEFVRLSVNITFRSSSYYLYFCITLLLRLFTPFILSINYLHFLRIPQATSRLHR